MSPVPSIPHRVRSIDIVRGLAMVIMALDHVRDFFHEDAFLDDPLNLATTTPVLYFTRWITHFCAPAFVFLAGSSAFLVGQRRSKKELSKFLISRGIWLVLVEILIITLGWTFNPFYNIIILQVIWAIGISMIFLGLLIWLPYSIILAIGLLIVFGHNLLDYPEAAPNGEVGFWWNLVHDAQFYYFPISAERGALIVYAFLPWTGVMALGYCFGALYKSSVPVLTRKKILIGLGLGLIVLFFVLRLVNGYGNPTGWDTHPRGPMYTLFSFLNVNKYPPSLMFLCMTLGPTVLLLAFIEDVRGSWSNFLLIYGRVPFFYYVLHFYLIHIFCVIAFYASGYSNSQIITPQFPFYFRPPNFGFDLWVVYAVWITVVLVLYPLCKWYNNYKAAHRHWWLSYT